MSSFINVLIVLPHPMHHQHLRFYSLLRHQIPAFEKSQY